MFIPHPRLSIRGHASLLHQPVTHRRDALLFPSSDKSVVSLSQAQTLRLRDGPLVAENLFDPQAVDDIVEERRKATTDHAMERAVSLPAFQFTRTCAPGKRPAPGKDKPANRHKTTVSAQTVSSKTTSTPIKPKKKHSR